MHTATYTCPVCGYADLDEPPYNGDGCASFDICPCCGVEFGYDDYTSSHPLLREKWIASGMLWWSTVRKPPVGWDPDVQLRCAGF